MTIPDVNLLLHAVDEHAPRHQVSRDWLEARLSGTETVGFAWMALLAFVRLSTQARISAAPLSAAEALDLVDGWLAAPPATVVQPGERHARVLRELLDGAGTAGNLTSDAHVAALAIEHGATLHSYDTDFARFSGLRWVNPAEGTRRR